MQINSKPLVSVIIIAYNLENLIDDCIMSALGQTFCDYEVILVNDGSTDATLAHMKKYGENGQVRIIDKKNGGIVSARKAGVEIARGDYITFVDGDDWINLDMLGNFIAELNGYQGGQIVDIIHTNAFFQEKDGDFIVEGSPKVKEKILYGNMFFEYIMADRLDHHMFPNLYRTEFIRSAGYLQYPNLDMAEDLMTNAFFGLFHPTVIMSDSINYYYRYNASSMIRKGGRKIIEQVDTIKAMEKFIIEKSNSMDVKHLLQYQWFSYCAGYVSSDQLIFSVKKEIVLKCKDKIGDYKNNPYCVCKIKEQKRITMLIMEMYLYMPGAAFFM